jgi:HEAT repeat protein
MPRVPPLRVPSLRLPRALHPRWLLRRGRVNVEVTRARRDGDVDALLAMLADADAGRRAEATAALARLGPPAAALDALLDLARDDAAGPVRREAVHALGGVQDRDPEVLSALQDALEDHHEPVVMFAAQALGRMRHEPSIPRLARTARSADAVVRLYAVEALARMRSRAAYDALVLAAEDVDRRVAVAALDGLGPVVVPADDEVLAGIQERLRWARRWRAERLRKDLGASAEPRPRRPTSAS